MDTLTAYGTGDFSSITVLSDYVGQRVFISANDGKRAYTGFLEFAALEDSSTSSGEESTLLLYFRGLDQPIIVPFPLNTETPTVLEIQAV